MPAEEPVCRYDSFFDYLDKIIDREGSKYSGKKTLLAEKIIPHMTKENLSVMLDMDESMDRICSIIKSWNS